MTSIYNNNKDGGLPVTITTIGNSTLSTISGAPDRIDNYGKQVKAEYAALPAVKESKVSEVINWLGSSYSGTDIKVVAHLYRDASVDQEIEKAREQKELSEAIVKGCVSITASLPTLSASTFSSFSAKRKAFIDSTNLDTSQISEQKALSFLLSRVFENGNFAPSLLPLKRRKIEYIRQYNQSLLTELMDQLKNLSLLEKDAQDTVVLATAQTVSLQTHRDKRPVRALGHSYVKGYSRGGRTIAGSFIFTVFNEHALSALIRSMGTRESIWRNREEFSTLLPDQLPPIDLTIAFANEYGSISELRIYGVEFVNDGMTMSIEDILTEGICNFVARDCDVMTSLGKVRLSRMQRGNLDLDTKEVSASSLTFNNQRYLKYLDKLGLRRRRLNR